MNISRNNERNFMKTLIATLAIAALLAGGTQRAAAGDSEWATAGRILTGVVVGAVIAGAIEPAPVYSYQPATWYAPPPPVYVQPAPMVVYSAPVCARPAPVVVFAPPRVVVSFGIGRGSHQHLHHRICR
jgi:O-antigen ligase